MVEIIVGFSECDPNFAKFKKKYDALGALVLDNSDGTSSVLLSDDYDMGKLREDVGFYGILEVR